MVIRIFWIRLSRSITDIDAKPAGISLFYIVNEPVAENCFDFVAGTGIIVSVHRRFGLGDVTADDLALSRGPQSVLNVLESGGTGNPSILELEWHLSAFIKIVGFSGHNLVLPERESRGRSTRINVSNGDDELTLL